jgi:hypothetical protein
LAPDLWILGLKALLAGTFVVLFSLLAEMLQPKMFAGLFAGAPVVAAVSLAITAAVKPAAAPVAAQGMIAGSIGMIACCAVAALVIRRTNSWVGSALSWASWAVVALGLYLLFAL